MEIEKINNLPFLDILLIKDCRKINRKVYQKKVRFDYNILNDAIASWAYNLSALKIYIHKTFKVCNDQYLREEINYIIDIASNRGFQPITIKEIIGRFNKPNLELGTTSMLT